MAQAGSGGTGLTGTPADSLHAGKGPQPGFLLNEPIDVRTTLQGGGRGVRHQPGCRAPVRKKKWPAMRRAKDARERIRSGFAPGILAQAIPFGWD